MDKKEKKSEKILKGSDIILNLKEISVGYLNSFSSSSCSGSVSFYIDCQTGHGYCEDPSFYGKIRILKTKKCREKGTYILKIKFEKEEEDQK